MIRFKAPALTVVLHDLYPNSNTYTQVYQGKARLGVVGTRVPDASVVANYSAPVNAALSIKDYDALLVAGGTWKLEVLTETPFGIDRLSYVSFKVDQTMKLHGNFTTIE